jgi:hypothetical protein
VKQTTQPARERLATLEENSREDAGHFWRVAKEEQ